MLKLLFEQLFLFMIDILLVPLSILLLIYLSAFYEERGDMYLVKVFIAYFYGRMLKGYRFAVRDYWAIPILSILVLITMVVFDLANSIPLFGKLLPKKIPSNYQVPLLASTIATFGWMLQIFNQNKQKRLEFVAKLTENFRSNLLFSAHQNNTLNNYPVGSHLPPQNLLFHLLERIETIPIAAGEDFIKHPNIPLASSVVYILNTFEDISALVLKGNASNYYLKRNFDGVLNAFFTRYIILIAFYNQGKGKSFCDIVDLLTHWYYSNPIAWDKEKFSLKNCTKNDFEKVIFSEQHSPKQKVQWIQKAFADNFLNIKKELTTARLEKLNHQSTLLTNSLYIEQIKSFSDQVTSGLIKLKSLSQMQKNRIKKLNDQFQSL